MVTPHLPFAPVPAVPCTPNTHTVSPVAKPCGELVVTTIGVALVAAETSPDETGTSPPDWLESPRKVHGERLVPLPLDPGSGKLNFAGNGRKFQSDEYLLNTGFRSRAICAATTGSTAAISSAWVMTSSRSLNVLVGNALVAKLKCTQSPDVKPST